MATHSARGQRAAGASLRFLAAVAVLMVVAVGIPIGLVVACRAGLGSSHPLPGLGTWDEIHRWVTTQRSSTELARVALRVLISLCWLLWAGLLLSVLSSVLAARPGLGRVRLPRLAMFDGFGAWIAAGLTALTSLAPNVAHAQPAISPAPATAAAAPSALTASDVAGPTVPATTKTGWETVQAAESIEMFAARTLGSRDRWPEVWELNQGRTMDDGVTFSQPWKLHAGWQLELPTATAAPPPAAAADAITEPASPLPNVRYRPIEEIVVVDDDNLWNLSQTRLRAVAAPDDDIAIAQLLNEVLSLNPSIDDPNLIYTGQRIVMPAVGTPPIETERPPPTTAQQERTHTIVDGDTLWDILNATYGYVDLPLVNHVADYNQLADPNNIPIGTVIRLPVLEPAEPLPTTAPPPPTAPAPAAEPPVAAPAPAPINVDQTAEVTDPPRQSQPAPTIATPPPASATTAAPAVEEHATPAAPQIDPASLPTTDGTSDDGREFPMAGALGMATVAAGIIAVVEARRRRRIRLHQPGQRSPVTPPPSLVSTELAARALAARSQLERAGAVTSALARCYRNGALPASALVQGIVIDDAGSATVHLDEPVPPAGPFTGSPTTWTVDTDTLAAGDPIGSVDQLLRTVVSVGRTDIAEVFVDLESLGSVAVHGDPESIAGIIAGVVDQLVDRDDVEIHSDQPLLDRTSGRLVAAQPVDAGLLHRLSADRQPLWEQLDRGELSSVIDARLADWPYEQLIPACVVTATDDAVALAAAAGGGGRGLAVISPSAGAVDWRAVDGTLELGHLGLVVTSPALLDPRSHQQLAALIGAEPEHDDPSLAVVNPSPQPPPAAPSEFHERDWTHMVRVLRPIPDVVDRDGVTVEFVDARNRNGRRGPELVAFLAARHDRQATIDDIRDALWWDDISANLQLPRTEQRRLTSLQTAASLAYRARSVIGGEHAIANVGGRWRLEACIVSDAELLADRLRFATTHHAPWAVLRDGLALIAGEPFQASKSYSWASASGHLRTVHETVSDLAVHAARQAIAEGRPQDALWACDQALLANPVNEIVIQQAFRIEASLDNLDGIRRRFQALDDQLRSLGDEPDPTTLDAYHGYINRRRSA